MSDQSNDIPMWIVKEVYTGPEGLVLKVAYDGSYISEKKAPKVGDQLILLGDPNGPNR